MAVINEDELENFLVLYYCVITNIKQVYKKTLKCKSKQIKYLISRDFSFNTHTQKVTHYVCQKRAKS